MVFTGRFTIPFSGGGMHRLDTDDLLEWLNAQGSDVALWGEFNNKKGYMRYTRRTRVGGKDSMLLLHD